MNHDQLRRLRHELGLTLHQLAKELGMSPNTINDYENAKRPIPRLFQLAIKAWEPEYRARIKQEGSTK